MNINRDKDKFVMRIRCEINCTRKLLAKAVVKFVRLIGKHSYISQDQQHTSIKIVNFTILAKQLLNTTIVTSIGRPPSYIFAVASISEYLLPVTT